MQLKESSAFQWRRSREMVDVNTIIGDPISAPNGTTIIPVSKVSFGFASGGSDLPTQAAEKFAGGAGAGVTVKPQAFIVIKTDGDVELLELGGAGKTSTGRRCRGYSGRYREDKGLVGKKTAIPQTNLTTLNKIR